MIWLNPRRNKLLKSIDSYTPAKMSESNQKIPKIIVQTNKDKNIPEGMYSANLSIIQMNPEYSYIYLDDKEAADFISKNFDSRVLDAYNKLKPGAFKADLFRCCWLYKNGGVYIDTGFVAKDKLENVIKPFHEFISVEDNGKNRIYNAFMASIPGHILLKMAIEKIVENVENENYGDDCLDVTGPTMLGKLFKKYTGVTGEKVLPNKDYQQNTIRLLKYDNNRDIGGDITDNGKLIFITKYPDYYEDQKVYNSKLRYDDFWKARDIFR